MRGDARVLCVRSVRLPAGPGHEIGSYGRVCGEAGSDGVSLAGEDVVGWRVAAEAAEAWEVAEHEGAAVGGEEAVALPERHRVDDRFFSVTPGGMPGIDAQKIDSQRGSYVSANGTHCSRSRERREFDGLLVVVRAERRHSLEPTARPEVLSVLTRVVRELDLAALLPRLSSAHVTDIGRQRHNQTLVAVEYCGTGAQLRAHTGPPRVPDLDR